MASALVVPGVSVEARFDVLPPLPSPAGIVGVIGIVDRPPVTGALVSVTKVAEMRDLLGPGTVASLPEAVHALRNGANEVVVSAVHGGASATADLLNDDSTKVLRLRCRANGTSGNDLSADLRSIPDATGAPVRVTLRLLRAGVVVEKFDGLRVAPGAPDDLFEAINTGSSLVVALDPNLDGIEPQAGTYTFADDGSAVTVPKAGGGGNLLELVPAGASAASSIALTIVTDGGSVAVSISVDAGNRETFSQLTMNPDSDAYLPFVLASQSRLVRARVLSSATVGKQLPRTTATPVAFAGGTSPTVQQHLDALDLLTDDSRIDMLLACLEPKRADADVHQIHTAMTAQAVTMADAGAPRIAFGSITADEDVKDAARLGRIRDHASAVRNRRFVLVSPPGAAGAVAGTVAHLDSQDAPTFKPTPLFEVAPARYREAELNVLLGPTTNLLVVQDRTGHGVIVLKGIDTTGDQVSVTRVADEAIRETKAICENYIGVLNSAEARIALKGQIAATFTRMERAGALVPSTDGKDPAFVVDVYSTQQDFAQGIVRVDIAVRPVRAIDYVYATIRVKN